MKKSIILLLVVSLLAASTAIPVSAAKGVDVYLDELSMSGYVFHGGNGYSWTDKDTGKVYTTPWIGMRFEHPGERPFYYDAAKGVNVEIESKHTIGGHEPRQGAIDHADFTWDVSAFAAGGSLPFSAQVCKAAGTQNAEYSVLVDGAVKWTSGSVTAENGLIDVSLNVPKGAKTLTLRADRGPDDDWTNGEYHWVEPKITLPSGARVTRMDKRVFKYYGNGGETKYWIGEKNDGNGVAADFWNASLNGWNKFTTKSVISGHQTHSADNGGNAYVTWDISDLKAGYFTVAVCSNTNYDQNTYHFYGQFSVLVDGEEKASSPVVEVTDGLWRATVEVPSDAGTLTVNVNNGGDEHTCGAFTVADPIFVGYSSGAEPVVPLDLYLDELSMSDYIFHSGLGYSANRGTNQPWIGERFEAPGERPQYFDSAKGQFVDIKSRHTIGGHEPFEGFENGNGKIEHADFTWDISAFSSEYDLPFSAKVCKNNSDTNAEYSVLVDGVSKWSSGVVTGADGLIDVSFTIPKGSETLTLRADRGSDGTWASGMYHWVDAKITLPAGTKITRMDSRSFDYYGNGGAGAYLVGFKHEKHGDGIADFWNAAYEGWNKFTTKHVISGHQTDDADNDGNAYVEWDVSDLGSGYFTTAVTSNWPNTAFCAQFSILIDGQEVEYSSVMKGSDGLWRGTVRVPAGAKKLTVNVNNGGDRHTCGAFTVADPIFVADPLGSAPTSDVTVSAAVASVVLGTLALVVCRGKKKKG